MHRLFVRYSNCFCCKRLPCEKTVSTFLKAVSKVTGISTTNNNAWEKCIVKKQCLNLKYKRISSLRAVLMLKTWAHTLFNWLARLRYIGWVFIVQKVYPLPTFLLSLNDTYVYIMSAVRPSFIITVCTWELRKLFQEKEFACCLHIHVEWRQKKRRLRQMVMTLCVTRLSLNSKEPYRCIE